MNTPVIRTLDYPRRNNKSIFQLYIIYKFIISDFKMITPVSGMNPKPLKAEEVRYPMFLFHINDFIWNLIGMNQIIYIVIREFNLHAHIT